MYKVGIYLRISNDDGDKIESNSIISQRSIIENFVNKQEDMVIQKEYRDDGYTGTNFNRPGFEQLLCDIESRIINCVIVKDLSRLGRNYVMTGYYLEQYFPLQSIRFIAINDNYDSLNLSSNDDFMMPIRNVFNAHYSKDISRKVKSALRAKQNAGEFVGAFACYGYKKDKQDKHKLIIDEEAATIVRRIFELYNQGYGKISIVNILNNEHIPCPSEYKKIKGLAYRNNRKLDYTTYWTYSTIDRILKNETYIGSVVQNKSERKTVRGKAIAMSEDKWIKSENKHDSIIDIHTWNVTQELLKKRGRQLDLNSNIGLFAGFIKCGDCGRSLAKVKNGMKVSYVCGTYKHYSSKLCTRHTVSEELLEKLILQKLNEEIAKLDESDFVQSKQKKQKVNDVSSYKAKLERLYKLKKESYEDYKSGLLTKEEYLSYREDYNKEELLINGQMEAILSATDVAKERNQWIENLKKYRKLEYLDRTILACILDSITVYETEEEKVIDIKLKYTL